MKFTVATSFLVALCSARTSPKKYWTGKCTAYPLEWYQGCVKGDKQVGHRYCGFLGGEIQCENLRGYLGCGVYKSDACVCLDKGSCTSITCMDGREWIKHSSGHCIDLSKKACPDGYTGEADTDYPGNDLGSCGVYTTVKIAKQKCDQNGKFCKGFSLLNDKSGNPTKGWCLKFKLSKKQSRKNHHFCRKKSASKSAGAVVAAAESTTEELAAPAEIAQEVEESGDVTDAELLLRLEASGLLSATDDTDGTDDGTDDTDDDTDEQN